MKQFSCGDVVPGCSRVFRGADDNEILAAVGVHAAADHGITVLSQEIVDAVRRNILVAA